MQLVTKFLQLFPRLLGISISSDFVLLIALMFIIALAVNITCYFFWGRY